MPTKIGYSFGLIVVIAMFSEGQSIISLCNIRLQKKKTKSSRPSKVSYVKRQFTVLSCCQCPCVFFAISVNEQQNLENSNLLQTQTCSRFPFLAYP